MRSVDDKAQPHPSASADTTRENTESVLASLPTWILDENGSQPEYRRGWNDAIRAVLREIEK